ncbi:HEAT repeat domain-containing protein [Cryobacterium psychrophilum]|uniref:HEAT repeat domain-containing protein n=1 Tax=Cryobacterium psychrophilum TaxID=41988 RepID=A0A4Y8KUJ9_9MICO|nr:HEAT repeat domain-containing protein [Cryobacterium psychrophilum]TDW30425.1 HEAT repeat protein [Cryobacterium psychrophilum]TFD79505.1 HEAT repeat domain-containing protein [Cryobacterium psychrophilum]
MRKNSSSEPVVPIDLPIADRIAAAVKRYGEPAVIDRSIALLKGDNAGEDFLLYVGGEHAQGILDGAPSLYWPELWGARALMYVWSESANETVIGGLDNQSWRVREMCAKVILLRKLHALKRLTRLTTDETPRVRAAAVQALAALGTVEHHSWIVARLRDPDKEVRRAAQQSRDALTARLGLPTAPDSHTPAAEAESVEAAVDAADVEANIADAAEEPDAT